MEPARDGSASSMRVAQEPAAEDGTAAFAGSFLATFAPDLIAIRDLHSQDVEAVASGCSVGHGQGELAANMGEITARTWLRLLRTLCRRFAGQLIVRGTLLNHEELLVTGFRRVPLGRQQEEDSGSGNGVRVGTRFVVRCVDTETSQIGREVVARILHQDKWSRGVNTEPVASSLDQQGAWRDDDTLVLEQLETIYGFEIREFATAVSTERDQEQDEDEEDQKASQADPMLMDFRAAQHLMRQRQIPHATGFQSFAMVRHPKYATAIVTQESDARSYRSIDAAQKRRWADERFHSGQELETKGRTKDAISEFSSCLKINETHVQALAARGRLYLQSKQFEESIRDLERVLELDASFPKIGDDLLRAKGTLHHSRHVVQSIPLLKQKLVEADRRSRDASRGRQRDESRGRQTENLRIRSPPPPERLPSAERLRSASSSKNLERDRLRELLEEETRKRDRRRKRSRYSDEDSSENDGSSRRRKEKKSSKKKSKKKKRKHKNKHRRRSDSSSSDYSSDDSYARRSPVRRSSRREKSPSRQSREEEEPAHPILLRQQHRIWK